MKTYESDWQITFEYKDDYGVNELEISEVSGDFEFQAENSNGDRTTLYLNKNEVKELVKFLESKI